MSRKNSTNQIDIKPMVKLSDILFRAVNYNGPHLPPVLKLSLGQSAPFPGGWRRPVMVLPKYNQGNAKIMENSWPEYG